MARMGKAYAPQLGAQLHITHTQLNIIGSPYCLVQCYYSTDTSRDTGLAGNSG